MQLNKYISQIQQSGKEFRLYIALCALRILLIFIPQNGYVHPDEFFQSVEVMAGDEFGLEHTRTWEFNATMPVRSVVIPFILYRIPFNVLRFINLYIKYYLNINILTSYTLIVFPRLITTLLSFLNDWSLYQICLSYGLKCEIRMITLASSYVMLIYSTRTFSNSIEMALCSYLFYIVAECMVNSNTLIFQTEFLQDKYKAAKSTVEKVKFYKMQAAVPSHTFNKGFLLSTLCVIGVFNRPTFILFGMPIVFAWLLRGMGTRTITFTDFNLRIGLFMLSSIPTLIFFIVFDSFYYLHLSLAELMNLDISINNFIVPPINFIRFNMEPKMTAQFGVHPKYLHLLVNVPLLLNILGVTAIISFGYLVYRFFNADFKHLPRAQSLVALATSMIFVPILFLSLVNHQEPRFLLPITMPIILLHAPKLKTGFAAINPFSKRTPLTNWLYKHILCQTASADVILKIWYSTNIVLTIFYGFIHQGGVIQLNRFLAGSPQLLDTGLYTHLVTSYMYKVPMSFFYLPSTKTLITNPNTMQKYRRTKRFFLYEYEEMDMDQLYKRLKLILDVNEKNAIEKRQRHQLLLAIPSSLSADLSLAFLRSNHTLIKHTRIKTFYPHLSTETMPWIYKPHPLTIKTDVFDVDRKCGLYEDAGTVENESVFSLSTILRQISSVAHQFGLALYKIEVRRKTN